MGIYKRLFKYIKPYWTKILVAVMSTGVVSMAEGATAWVVKPILDDIFISKDQSMLNILPFAVIALYFLKGFFRFLSSYLMSSAGHSIVMDLRNVLFSHITLLSVSFFSKSKTGDLLSRVVNDVSVIQGMVSIAIKDMIRESLTMVVLLVVLFYRDPKLALISILVLPASVLFMAKIGKRLRKLGKSGQEKIADISSILVETFTGTKLIKAFAREDYIHKKFEDENRRFYAIMMKTIKYRELTSPLLEFLGACGLAAIIWYGGSSVISGETSVGNFFSFITALLMLYSPIRRLSNINNNIQHALASATRIFEVLDTKTDIGEKENAVELKSFEDSIEYKNVSFKYDSDLILKDISLKVRKGETIALVGVSGAGKTTMIDLIPRFYDTVSGEILVDGVNVCDVTLSSLRNMVAIVTQDVFLFNDTIKGNISFGNLNASYDDMILASKAAYAHDFIMEMPGKYDTVVGERGVRLSGGQRQRLAIARALLKDPLILILDEATSALDTESELIVQEALTNLMKNRTSFVVAHRLSTILNADKIIVLNECKIIETGKHSELLSKGGAYKKVFDMQFANG